MKPPRQTDAGDEGRAAAGRWRPALLVVLSVAALLGVALALGWLLARWWGNTRLADVPPATSPSGALVASARVGGGAASAPIEISYSGCQVVRRGSGCELRPERALRLWVPGPTQCRVQVKLDAGDAVVEISEAQAGGQRLQVEVPAQTRRLSLFGTCIEPAGWHLALMPHAPLPEPLVEAGRLRKKRQLVKAAELVSETLPTLEGETLTRGKGLLARIKATSGAHDEAQALLSETMGAHLRAGAFSLAADDGFALVYYLLAQHRLGRAREVLRALEPAALAYPDGATRLQFYRGYLSRQSEDLRAALSSLREAELQSRRSGLVSVERMAAQVLAEILPALGRHDETLRRLERMQDAAKTNDCVSADLAADIGSVHFQASLYVASAEREAHRRRSDQAYERALKRYQEGCTDELRIADVRMNMAWNAVLRGGLEDASTQLAKARAEVVNPPPLHALWWLEVQGRIELKRRRAKEALALFEREEELAEVLGRGDDARRSKIGQAEAQQALGRSALAIDAAQQAAELLDRLGVDVPLGEGREQFLAGRRGGSELLTDLLLQADRPREALLALRRARGRLLATMERVQRRAQIPPSVRDRWEVAIGRYYAERERLEQHVAEDWKLSRGDLQEARRARPAQRKALEKSLQAALAVLGEHTTKPALSMERLPEGTTRLAFQRLAKHWLVIAEQAGEVEVQRLPIADASEQADALASQLLALVQGRLEKARALRIHATGLLRQVDFHALTWHGQPLVKAFTVAYALDAGPPAESRAGHRALLVGDPTHDLRYARSEVGQAAKALRQLAWTPQVRLGDEAVASDIRRELVRADLFHYSGHSEASGRDGWGGRLPLAGGGHLRVADVLALDAVPRTVVLSACRASPISEASPWAGLGLAQAFLVAGSAQVIAPTRDVRDALAQRLAAALYREAEHGAFDAVGNLARAQRALLAEEPGLDWAAYRVVIR